MLSRCWKYVCRRESASLVHSVLVPAVKHTLEQPHHVVSSLFTCLPNKLLQGKAGNWTQFTDHTIQKQQYKNHKRLFVGTLFVFGIPTLWLKFFSRSECLGLQLNGNPEEISLQTLEDSRNESFSISSEESVACDEFLPTKDDNFFERNEKEVTGFNTIHLEGRLLEAIVLTRAQVFMLHDLVSQELFRFVAIGRSSSPSIFHFPAITFMVIVGSIVHWCYFSFCGKELFSLLASIGVDNLSKLKFAGSLFGHYFLLFVMSNMIATTVFFILHHFSHNQNSHTLKEVGFLLTQIRVILNDLTLNDRKSLVMISRDCGDEWNEEFHRMQTQVFLTLHSCTLLLREQIKRFQDCIRTQSKDSKDNIFSMVTLTSAIGSSILFSRILLQWKTFLYLTTWIDDESYSNVLSCTWYAIISGLYAWYTSELLSDKYLHFLHKDSENYLETVREQYNFIFTLWSQLENEAKKQLFNKDSNNQSY